MVTQTRTHTIKKWQKGKTSCDMARILHLQVLEGSSVLSFATWPISVRICPVILLFCSGLGQKTPPNNKKGTLTQNLRYTREEHLQCLKIDQVPYAWGEQIGKVLAWSFPAKQSNNHRTTRTWELYSGFELELGIDGDQGSSLQCSESVTRISGEQETKD
jgi:hypothetical protein